MNSSQCLEDSPLRGAPRPPGTGELNLQEVYNERHRLALEELLSGGLENFLDFLRREKISNFLSDDEIQRIRSAAVPPRCASLHGDEPGLDQSLGGSVDCSSVTYFPEVSDVEPPLLEMGWPAFTAGSYRGVTRAVAHFQPSYGEFIYSCKEAARRMIKSAKEVIAIVTDSLTDPDIFKDLQEACTRRGVPVYVLLDQSCAAAFLKMCRNVGVHLDDLQQMRVRTVTGTTYYMRSGARITGEVHERFMLIDGNRVATGSYRFNWTDGKLNSSNLIELSGQISEKFDEEFRILYAQSLPINTRGPSGVRNSGVYEHLLVKPSSSSSPHLCRERPGEAACLTSTPSRKLQVSAVQLPPEPDPHVSSPLSDSSTVKGNWTEEILAGSTTRRLQGAEEQVVTSGHAPGHASSHAPCHISSHAPCHASNPLSDSSTVKGNWTEETRRLQAEEQAVMSGHASSHAPCHASSHAPCHASNPLSDSSTVKADWTEEIVAGSTTRRLRGAEEQVVTSGHASSHAPCHASTQTGPSVSDGDAQTDLQLLQHPDRDPSPPQAAPDASLKDSFHKLSRERRLHYSAIRSKLQHMVASMSERRRLADVTNMTQGFREREEPDPRPPGGGAGVGTWPRARCVH